MDEVGSTSLFGARFRMNAARALLLPRGSPKRRMPLWLQRLKALDLLDAVRRFPSFPILVETYREVLQDAFDMAALQGRARLDRRRPHRDPNGGDGARVAVRGEPAARIRDGLAVRRRHAEGGAAGGAALDRSRIARRGDGHGGRGRGNARGDRAAARGAPRDRGRAPGAHGGRAGGVARSRGRSHRGRAARARGECGWLARCERSAGGAARRGASAGDSVRHRRRSRNSSGASC